MQSIPRYEQRTEVVKTANRIIEESNLVWSLKKPFEDVDDSEDIRNCLQVIKNNLFTLKEIKLPSPPTMDQITRREIARINEQRIEYFEKAILIPERLLKKLDKFEGRINSRLGRFFFRGDYEPNQTFIFFDYARAVMATNDGAMAIKKAEQVRERQYTADELNEHSRQTALSMHGYLTRRERIPDKSPSQIADYVWSGFNIMQQIEPIDDENVLYHTIAIGHPVAWEETDNRRPDGIRYINSVKNSHDICFPELLAILTSPYIVELMVKNKAKGQVPPKLPYVA
jgi:hypothetical protein